MKIINVPLNIPNILSLYRLFSFPFILIFVFTGEQTLFTFFICFNLFTDVLDGWIARRFNQATEIGSKLDSLADSGMYILVVAGIIAFKWPDFEPYLISASIFMGLFLISDILPLIRFGKYGSFHTYGAKIGAYLKGAFFIVLFVSGFYAWFYYLIIITGIIAFIESIIIALIIKELKPDVKGLWWVLKEIRKT